MAKFAAEKFRQCTGKVAKTAAKGERSSAVHGRKIPCLSLFLSRRGRTESRESLTRRGLSAWSSAALFLKSLFFSLLAGNSARGDSFRETASTAGKSARTRVGSLFLESLEVLTG